jgi:hypothetical protein
MKKVRHSKFKNTGVLFELLTRQITYEIMNGDTSENAKKIVKEFFNRKTELSKELELYNLLMNEKYNSETKAEKFIDAILETRQKLDTNKLSREKYNLVKRIKENFDMSAFLSSNIPNYRILASIHKVFESKKEDISDVKDIFNSRCTIVEHISSKPVSNKAQKADAVLEMYRKEDSDVRMLSHKILIKTFNDKYSKLNENQKLLLRQYINNVSNTSKFSEYYKGELKTVVTELHKLHKDICDTVTQIKLRETINQLKQIRVDRKVGDNQVSALMIAYELINEIRNVKSRIS